MIKGKVLFALGALAVILFAVAMHLHGPDFVRNIHGGKLWPW